jgi:hypothetical protein
MNFYYIDPAQRIKFASKIFNYKKMLQNLNIDDWSLSLMIAPVKFPINI